MPPVKPVEIDYIDIRARISIVPIGLSVSNPQISPDGRWRRSGVTAVVGQLGLSFDREAIFNNNGGFVNAYALDVLARRAT